MVQLGSAEQLNTPSPEGNDHTLSPSPTVLNDFGDVKGLTLQDDPPSGVATSKEPSMTLEQPIASSVDGVFVSDTPAIETHPQPSLERILATSALIQSPASSDITPHSIPHTRRKKAAHLVKKLPNSIPSTITAPTPLRLSRRRASTLPDVRASTDLDPSSDDLQRGSSKQSISSTSLKVQSANSRYPPDRWASSTPSHDDSDVDGDQTGATASAFASPTLSSALASSTSSLGGHWLAQGFMSSFKALFNQSPPGDDADARRKVEWEYWGRFISMSSAETRQASSLPIIIQHKKVYAGIPSELRGMVWQIMSHSRSARLEDSYNSFVGREAIQEKVILRDITRTYPEHQYFQSQAGQQTLFNVLKAYSMLDTEIGYCQGIAFLVGPLLLNMPEEDAFAVLVALMRHFKFRDLYTPTMSGLSLKLFQFDELLKMQFPSIFEHFKQIGVVSSMYASQWFMTLFAYRLPLDVVVRLMDVVLLDGVNAMLKFGLALIQKNSSTLLALQFDACLEFLKLNLFNVYNGDIDSFMEDAYRVKISPASLEAITAIYQVNEEKALHRSVMDQYNGLKSHNLSLQATMKRMREEYELLNREHIELANEYTRNRLVVEDLTAKLEERTERLKGLEAVVSQDRSYAEQAVQAEMETLVMKNMSLTQTIAVLSDRVAELEDKLARRSAPVSPKPE